MSERTRAILMLVACAILWSVGGMLIKWVNWHPLAICGVRSAIAAILIVLVMPKLRFTWSLAQIGGGVAYAATVLLYVPSVKMTTAANAVLLQYTAPIWVALFSAWFLKERVTKVDWLCVVVAVGGMALFFREGLAGGSFWGDLLATLSGVSIAWMTLFMRKQKDGSPVESVLIGNVLAALGGLPFAFSGPGPGLQGWVGLLLLGVFQLGISYMLYAEGIKHVQALDAMLISTIEPILNPIWVLLLIKEVPSVWALLGGALVISAITARGWFQNVGPSLAARRVAKRAA
ncbi:MAG: DMT family transporter [Anaerolineae bacterium]